MSSLDELDVAADSGDDVTPAPADVLAAVKTEGGRRRTRRHRRNAVIGVLGLAVLALPAVSLLPGDDDDEVTVAADAESTTTEARRTTTSVTATTVTTETTVVAAAPIGNTPTPLVCRNSSDPDCGGFRWDPAPGPNQPLAASFFIAPATAAVGEEVTFIVDWSDADADQISDAFSTQGVSLGGPCSVDQRYGPWTPPAARAGSGTRTFRHTFTSPGVYPITVDLFTGNVCDHPYASETHLRHEITVVEPTSPTS